jgi:transketolase
MAPDREIRLGARAGGFFRVGPAEAADPPGELCAALGELNLIARALIAATYNYTPCSGHPGGSLSASRILESLLYGPLEHDLSAPDRPEADRLVLAAGHKALLLYVELALRDELARCFAPELLPASPAGRLRLEDLLGFRHNPTHGTPLFTRFRARPLDGHPGPGTPFVPVCTGASGVGLAAACGLAHALLDRHPQDPPRVHVLEGEAGLTPGRVQEALAGAACAGLWNLVVHVDWNQASIDSERVCRDEHGPGDYVPWDPIELFRFHGFHVLEVEDGLDHAQALAALARWRALPAGPGAPPAALVYRTRKGFGYPLTGRASHGAGPTCCSPAFFETLAELETWLGQRLPRDCPAPQDAAGLEAAFFALLERVRARLPDRAEALAPLPRVLRDARARLLARGRAPRAGAPRLEAVFAADATSASPPSSLREALGEALGALNRASGGALLVGSADLAQSTSIALAAQGFPAGFYHAARNPGARLVAVGGICEDALAAWMSGVAAAGFHLGVVASYAAFLAPLGHVAARLFAIGEDARRRAGGAPAGCLVLVCAHAGLKTGEDGPTHADPQALQLLQQNFPPGACISLTPAFPDEVEPCLRAALAARPAVVAPFVTRPAEPGPDRAALALPPAGAAARGVVAWRQAPRGRRPAHGSVVLVGAGVAHAFAVQVLPRLDAAGLRPDVYCVVSPELFDRLPDAERAALFPPERAADAVGLTDFTEPVLFRWVTSEAGRAASRHAFSDGHYPGSGQAARVLAEVGLDAEGLWRAARAWAERPRGA